MSSDLMRLVMMVLLTYPVAVVLLLSTWIGDRGCGQPISVKALRSGTISWAHLNRAASSASPAEAYTDLITAALESSGPLECGMGSSLDRKICAPARLRDLVSLR